MLIPVKHGELQHPASDDFSLLKQLRQMHRGIICQHKSKCAYLSPVDHCWSSHWDQKWNNIKYCVKCAIMHTVLSYVLTNNYYYNLICTVYKMYHHIILYFHINIFLKFFSHNKKQYTNKPELNVLATCCTELNNVTPFWYSVVPVALFGCSLHSNCVFCPWTQEPMPSYCHRQRDRLSNKLSGHVLTTETTVIEGRILDSVITAQPNALSYLSTCRWFYITQLKPEEKCDNIVLD